MFHNHNGWRHRVRAFLFGDSTRAVEPYYDDRSYADPGIGSRRAARSRDDGRPIPSFLSAPSTSPIEQEICDHLAEKGYHPQPVTAAIRPWKDDVARALAGIGRPRGIFRPQPIVANGVGGDATGHGGGEDGETQIPPGANYARLGGFDEGEIDSARTGISAQNRYPQHVGRNLRIIPDRDGISQDSEIFGTPSVRVTMADPEIEAFVAKVRNLSSERDQLEQRVAELERKRDELDAHVAELTARLDKITAALGQS